MLLLLHLRENLLKNKKELLRRRKRSEGQEGTYVLRDCIDTEEKEVSVSR